MHTLEKYVVMHSHTIAPQDWLRFVQIDPFPQRWSKLGLLDDDLRALEILIMANPGLAPVIRGGNGLRKLRFSTPASNRGKRGAYRIFYVYLEDHGIVLLLAILSKSDESDLRKADVTALAQVIDQIKNRLDRGVIR